MTRPLQKTIEEAYASRETWKTNPPAAIIKAVNDALQALDEGRLRIASKSDDGWQVHQWLKQAILLSFMLRGNDVVSGFMAYDKVPLKFAHWTKARWDKAKYSRGSWGGGASFGVYWQECCCDAVICQCGGVCGRRHND